MEMRPSVLTLNNVGIVVESLDAVIPFFEALGLALEGRMTVDGEWAGRVTGLADQRVEIAMLATPDGLGRIELSRFLEPAVASDHRQAAVNSLGYLRAMFTVNDIEGVVRNVLAHSGALVGEVVRYQDFYKLCYVRGPEGILIGLAEELTPGA